MIRNSVFCVGFSWRCWLSSLWVGGDKPLKKSAVVEQGSRQTHQYSHLTGERIQWDTQTEVCAEDEVPRHLRSSWDLYRTVF